MNKEVGAVFYVYVHRTKELGLPFYIGKGSGKRITSKTGRNPYWHNVVNTYGYTADYVAENLTETEAFELERGLISLFKSAGLPHLTNLTNGGEGASGLVHSFNTKKKISEALSGSNHFQFNTPRSEETRRKISEGMRGKQRTAEHRRKLSEAQKREKSPNFGKPLSDKTRLKISEALRGENNPNFGKRLSESTRRKISDAKRGKKRKPLSEEHQRNLNAAYARRKTSKIV